ncbi:MAG: ankyrin repeat domain-containing protein [Nannocystaceae bacterium]|nr:ankyrin repeat domain-containing protein [Nannocystaceae bacterium]
MDPNCVHRDSGYTPLHYAVTNRCSDNVRLLLARGADPHRPDASGETPTNYADPTRWGEGAMAREHPIRVALGV